MSAFPARANRLVAPLAAAASLVLAACATPPPPDTSPLLRSAIVVSNVTNGGLKGQFATKGRRTDKTIADMRRVDDESKFSGSILGRIGPSRDTSEIVRIDKGVIWSVDNKAENYRECPLAGCPSYLELLGANEQDYAQESELDACRLTPVTDEMSLVRTGERREIGEFATEEYLFVWKSEYADDAGESMKSELTSQIWTTELVGEPAEAAALDAAFEANYRRAIGIEYPEALVTALPGGALDVLGERLIQTLDDPAVNALYARLNALAPVNGYPVSRTVEWQASDGTCAAVEEPERDDEDDLDTGSFRGLLASVGKKIVSQEIDKRAEAKRRELELAPVYSFVETVESIDIGDIRESRLTVPADYDLLSRR